MNLDMGEDDCSNVEGKFLKDNNLLEEVEV